MASASAISWSPAVASNQSCPVSDCFVSVRPMTALGRLPRIVTGSYPGPKTRMQATECARWSGGIHAAQTAGSTSPIGPRNSASASGSIGVGWLLTITMRAPASFATGTTPATG